MPLTIVEKNEPGFAVSDYVWLDKLKIEKLDVHGGTMSFTVDIQNGTVDFLKLPIGVDRAGAQEIINALQEIMPLLKNDEVFDAKE